MTLLALDVGNTNITAGLFEGRRLAARFRLETDPRAGAAALARALRRGAGRRGSRVTRAVYGSVVPALDRPLSRAVRLAFGCRAGRVDPGSRLGIGLRVRKPGQVGADRLLNALAAFERARGPAVVVDFGTATTFDCVDGRGDYLGGAILPGPRMAASALAEGTAKLPLVAVVRPRRAIGKDTVECIQAGLYFGYLGMIEKVLSLTLAEMPGRRAKLIVTGGLSRLFLRDLPRPRVWAPDLTLEGLRIAAERLS